MARLRIYYHPAPLSATHGAWFSAIIGQLNRCASCARSCHDGKLLVEVAGSLFCDGCIERAADIIAEKLGQTVGGRTDGYESFSARRLI